MDGIFQLNPDINVPIYRQLTDSIRSAVKRGVLEVGQQLPTVQDLSADLSIAVGTIKRAYDELEREGIVEKVQGRGTFVCYEPVSRESRKDRAMAAIDELLKRLEDMGLSAAEINIFLNLKLRQHAETERRVKVAVLECNPENLTNLSEQLRTVEGVEIHAHLMDSIAQYPYKLGEDIDMVVTTATHAQQVESMLPVPVRVIRVGLRLTPACLAEIVKLRGHQVAGILCYSPRFGHLLQRTCQTYAEDIMVPEPVMFAPDMDIVDFLKNKDAVLVPKDFEKYCTLQVARQLQGFNGKLIRCSYELDDGSFLYLQEKTKRLLETKNI